ncbi:MAG: MucR family transcriptional regulator [Novosphingobium sp.]
MADDTSGANTLELATELTIAWLSNPNTRASADEVPLFLNKMHQAVNGLSAPAPVDEAPTQSDVSPAVSVRKSLSSKDHIISMIDGKPYKTLRRHLARHGMTPEQYRERFSLRSDYPMVSEKYSQVRRDMAKKIGLGRKAGSRVGETDTAPAVPEAKPGRGRRSAPKAE